MRPHEEPGLIKITYIGHGTTLIEGDGQHFLTDPNFSDKILGFRRRRAPGMDPSQLPALSAILVSHSHYDHLDLFSYKFFKTSVPILCPKGVGKFIRKFLPNPVVEIPLGGQHVHRGVPIHLAPVHHHGFRWLPIRYRPAGAFVLQFKEGTVYFAGDTGPGAHFQKTSELFNIDVALLPIGGFPPAWLHKKSKMNPEMALQAFKDLKAKHLVPTSWGVFDFFSGKEPDPVEALKKLSTAANLQAQVHPLEPGKSLNL
jgi:Predicted Zn-dependent hydrolases of the beta-lactamase fold